jgi:predicted dehydrogenase
MFTADLIRLVTLDPGHFHAALFQKVTLPGVSNEAFVYAPLAKDVMLHLDRIAGFNARHEDPTCWKLRTYFGPDYFERLIAERPGNVAVLSGNNHGKIDRVNQLVDQKVNVLADKPWIIDARDFPKLEKALNAAEANEVVAYDAMTQRYEISSLLKRELVNDQNVFGAPLSGSPAEPGVSTQSVHYLSKLVAGEPNLRPPWFFDTQQQGEALTDVGTHLVDQVQWTLFPNQSIEHENDIRVLDAERWPTILTLDQFTRITGHRKIPEYLRKTVDSGCLHYCCNNRILYTIRGLYVQLDMRWHFADTSGGGDTEVSIFHGSKSRIEVRQEREQNYLPQVYVIPNQAGNKAEVREALEHKLHSSPESLFGMTIKDEGTRMRVAIPDQGRSTHEGQFALLVKSFIEHVRTPRSLPSWERPYMLAKYYVTTKGVEIAQKRPISATAIRV